MARKRKSQPVGLKQGVNPRPPVVAVLGHVDHGKTTLLSAIRETDLTKKEHGGITQHIGAYQIKHKKEKITFIDTPGHAAFSKMRSHGVSVTDLVLLVVAADDGVKPQTKESLAHIKQAKVPFIVVINKVDLPQASVETVKSQLAENEVLVEGYGGDIVCLEVSAKAKKGINELLEMILLVAKMEELKAEPKAKLQGVVIDSKLDSKKGPLATVLIQKGTLKISDQIFTPEAEGKVKIMFDESGTKLKKAQPAQPAVVLGFKKVPLIGSQVTTEKISKTDKIKSEKPEKPAKPKSVKEKDKPVETKETELEVKESEKEEEKKEIEKIKIILKADTAGVLEAIENNLSQEVEIIFSNTGPISESDVLLAQTTNAQIIAFNVRVPFSVKKLLQTEKVNIKSYNIIYELLEDLEKRVLKILEPTIDEKVLAEAEVIAEFTIKGSHIAGCKVKKGKINKKDMIHIKREDEIIASPRIKSFQKEKQEVDQVKAGNEVGIVFSPDVDFQIGDAIISYSKNK